MYRLKRCIVVAVMTLMVCVGCAKEKTNKASAGVLMEPGGRVQVKFEENLDKDYYDSKELEKFIDEEVADFNEIYGEGSLNKASFAVKDNKATLWYEFADGKSYVNYMTDYVKAENVEFGVYTYKDAIEAGIKFEGEFIKVGEEGTVGKDKFEETDKLMVLYTNQEMCVYIPEDIVYTSKDVSVDKDTANTKAEKNNYILYKVEE
ncbi:MAG: hypothetical protein E7270_10445 [Lachnospiraceae bacterium]|nr:hypothetical protein [Lachnospiraceae bacterium]